jgi:hypothetical protein
MIPMPKAFVIHVHSGYGPTHYDLMLHEEQALATWQFDASPADLRPGESLPCRKIQDHRAAYLTYEGAVSGGRGDVKALDRGRYEPLRCEEGRREVRLKGELLRGRFELRRESSSAERWLLRRIEEDPCGEIRSTKPEIRNKSK